MKLSVFVCSLGPSGTSKNKIILDIILFLDVPERPKLQQILKFSQIVRTIKNSRYFRRVKLFFDTPCISKKTQNPACNRTLRFRQQYLQ